jgi:hypothetical protein
VSTFTANGSSSEVVIGNVQKNVILSVTGPWDGRLTLQRSALDGGSWTRVWEKLDSSKSVALNFLGEKNSRYRLTLYNTVSDVTNGAFTGNITGWTAGSGWSASGNKADAAGAISTALTQAVTGLVPGASYAVTFTTTRAAGGVLCSLGGGTAGTEITGSSTQTQTIVAGSSNNLLAFTGNGFTGTVDTVSLTPVITYSLAVDTPLVEEIKTIDGLVVRSVDSDGLHTIPGALTVAGTTTLSGTLVTTGTVTPTSIGGSPLAELQATDPSQKCTWFTDFLGDAAPVEYDTKLGSGTGNAAALTTGQGGRFLITTASDDGADTANFTAIAVPNSLSYRADATGLVMEARLQLSAITNVCLFVGFTDALPSTGLAVPIFLNAADIDSSAADACGVGFDTDGTTAQWFHGGVKANTDTVPAYSGAAPAATTWYTVRVEVSAAGAVTGYIDGTAIGTAVADAVTATTPLVPVIYVGNRSGAARTCTVDYVWVQQNR